MLIQRKKIAEVIFPVLNCVHPKPERNLRALDTYFVEQLQAVMETKPYAIVAPIGINIDGNFSFKTN
jgi:hypothetical protein